MKGKPSISREQAVALSHAKGRAAAAKAAGVSLQTISNWRLAARVKERAAASERNGKRNGKRNGLVPPPGVFHDARRLFSDVPTNAAPVTGDALTALRADIVRALEQLDAMRAMFEQIQRMRAAFEGTKS